MSISSQIHALFREKGDSQYGGEAITQLEHALQCAQLAEQAQAPPNLVVAALLHDIGHLLHDLPQEAPAQGVDDRHEASGYHFLQQHFDSAVSEPVRLHVAAKRYLCTVDESYFAQLSGPSAVSLRLQGGKMNEAELSEFSSSPHLQAALQLRRWDDHAKVTDLPTPGIEHFLPLIEQVASGNDDIRPI